MATTPQQLTSQKLEENPLLPLDNQKNLVYVLTRIFRLLAQIVNPLVAWAGTWKYVSPFAGTWGTGITIDAQPPETGPNTALILDAAAPAGNAQIAGNRDGLRYWDLLMPDQSTQGHFKIDRHNPPNTHAGTPFQINRTNGTTTLTGDLQIAAGAGTGSDPTRSLLYMNGGSGNANFFNFNNGAGVLRWQWQYNDGAATLARFNDAGTFIGNSVSINRTSGITTLSAVPTEKTVLALQDTQTGTSQGANIRFDNSSWGSRWMRLNATGYITLINNSYNIETHGFSNEGHTLTTGYYSTSHWNGLRVTGTNGIAGQYTYQDLIVGNPNWATLEFRSWHQHGSYAGFTMQGEAAQPNVIQFTLSNGGTGWGSISALAFNVQPSDERFKEQVAPLEPQHETFMQMMPISWHWPTPPAPKEGDAPMYSDMREQWGFSTQNLASSVALAVNGEVGAVDAKGQPVASGYNPIPIIAVTVVEVQELWKRIATLEQRVAQLETA